MWVPLMLSTVKVTLDTLLFNSPTETRHKPLVSVLQKVLPVAPPLQVPSTRAPETAAPV